MTISEDEQWSRLAAESELKPDHGIIEEVPKVVDMPVREDDPEGDSIEIGEVPESTADDDGSEAEPSAVPPIQVVPFRAGPMTTVSPNLIRAAPFKIRTEVRHEIVEQPVDVITDVPVSTSESEIVADLPENHSQPEKTRWWRLMLGGGATRFERKTRTPQAAEPQPTPVPPERNDS